MGQSALGNSVVLPSGIVLLADTTLGSAGQFDLTSIAQTYKHLKLICSLRADDNGNFGANVRFNNDSGANYNYDLAGTVGVGQTAMLPAYVIGKNIGTAQFSAAVIDIPDYAGANQKTLLATSGHAPGGTSSDYRVGSCAGSWANTAAITRITIFTSGGTTNFVAGSRISLYGMA